MHSRAAVTSSTARPSESTKPWVERLFQKFEDWYGAKWAALYGPFPRERVMQSWYEELVPFVVVRGALSAAVEVQKQNPHPPTLPEFRNLCKEAAWRIRSATPVLPHKFSDEDLAKNRKRLSEILGGLKLKAAGREATPEEIEQRRQEAKAAVERGLAASRAGIENEGGEEAVRRKEGEE